MRAEEVNSHAGSSDVAAGCSLWGIDKNINGENKRIKKVRQFKPPEVDDKIKDISKKQFAPESRCKIKWAVNLYCGWRSNRLKTYCENVEILRADLDRLVQFNQSDLCFAMCRFVREVKKLNGDEYPPNTLREIVIMIQMYLHENGVYWKLIDHPQFVELRNVLDNTMKE